MKNMYGCLAICAAILIPSFVVQSPALATKQKAGDIEVVFLEPAVAREPYKVLITAVPWTEFKYGELVVAVSLPGRPQAKEEILWSGAGQAFDTLIASYGGDELPLGKTKIYAVLRFPNRRTGILGLSAALYVEARDTVVLTSDLGFRRILADEIRSEQEARGLMGASREEIERVAPDLAARQRALSSSTSLGFESQPDDTTAAAPRRRRPRTVDGDSLVELEGGGWLRIPANSDSLTREKKLRIQQRLKDKSRFYHYVADSTPNKPPRNPPPGWHERRSRVREPIQGPEADAIRDAHRRAAERERDSLGREEPPR